MNIKKKQDSLTYIRLLSFSSEYFFEDESFSGESAVVKSLEC